jgi:hypothetical protein
VGSIPIRLRQGRKGKEVFFFEKKNQKTFVHGVGGHWRKSMLEASDKSFLLLFFKKEGLPFVIDAKAP